MSGRVIQPPLFTPEATLPKGAVDIKRYGDLRAIVLTEQDATIFFEGGDLLISVEQFYGLRRQLSTALVKK